MEVFSKSDIGLVRNENQDSVNFGVVSPSCVWAVVCDGMGGAAGGKTASKTAVDYIAREINNLYSEDFTKEELVTLLTNIVIGANLEVYNMAEADIELQGMGTTCDLVFVRNDKVHIVHVGDSRTYIISNDEIKLITEDHSVVQEMVNRGEITEEEAQHHPNKNFITRALGINSGVKIDYVEHDFTYGDTILICSDGLSNCVEKSDMLAFVKDYKGEELTNVLVEKAKENGGSDNISVIVIY
ncbi:MAG: Stp1/IreP family PP2C-type Ser/Thr phosphatase [Acutalibacteraceae bacterium]